MTYNFFADSIELGIDDAEEVYSARFTASMPGGGPPQSYLLLQRSVAGVSDPSEPEPYLEVDHPGNRRSAGSVEFAELLPNYLHLRLDPAAAIVPPNAGAGAPQFVENLVVHFDADALLMRRLKYALEIVVADGFPLTCVN